MASPKICRITKSYNWVAYLILCTLYQNRTALHSNLCSHTNSTLGTFPCSTDRFKTCPHLCTDTSIRGPNGHMSIKRTFTCQSDNLVYAITCQSCNLIYVGETSRSIVVHFSEHLADVRHNRSKPVAQHFNSASHTLRMSKGYGNCMGTPFNENTLVDWLKFSQTSCSPSKLHVVALQME